MIKIVLCEALIFAASSRKNHFKISIMVLDSQFIPGAAKVTIYSVKVAGFGEILGIRLVCLFVVEVNKVKYM